MTNETFQKIKAKAIERGITRMIVRHGDGWISIEIPRKTLSATAARNLFGPLLDRTADQLTPFMLIGKLNFFSARIKRFQLISGGLNVCA